MPDEQALSTEVTAEQEAAELWEESNQKQEELTWQKADFYTDKPYKWLYEQPLDEFERSIAEQKMRAAAKAAGLNKGQFDGTYKAYIKKRAAERRRFLNLTDFPDQPLELSCGEYVCDEAVTVFDTFGKEIVVCQHPIYPVARHVCVNTGEVKLSLAYRLGGQWKTEIFDKTTLASSVRILELAGSGIAVDSTNAMELTRYITNMESYNYSLLPEKKSVDRLGWLKGSKYAEFLPYAQGVGYDGTADNKLTFDSVTSSGDYSAWLALMGKIRRESPIAHIQLAASFASALVEPLGVLPFFVHTWGGTEAGKTVGLMAAASVWANPAPGQYVKSFNSTTLGLTYSAGFLNSLPLCIDELQVIKDKSGGFDNIIYTLTEGVGRVQAKRTGGTRPQFTWHNCMLTTGEMPLSGSTSGGGAVNRIINIDCGGKKLFSDPKHVADTVRQNFGFAGRTFVSNVAVYMDELKGAYSRHYKDLTKNSGSTEKQCSAAAAILTADELAERWIFHDGQALKAADLLPYLTSVDEIDQNKRALDWLYDTVAANCIHFDARNNDYHSELWGEISEGYIYFIKTVFDKKMHEAGFNPTAFLSWAKNRGLLKCNEGRSTLRKRVRGINQVNARCVAVIDNSAGTNQEEVGTISNKKRIVKIQNL